MSKNISSFCWFEKEYLFYIIPTIAIEIITNEVARVITIQFTWLMRSFTCRWIWRKRQSKLYNKESEDSE